MTWPHLAACFLGGAFIANFVPHFVAGVTGRQFPTPFAKPPFRGLSSPTVNVLWSLINLAVAYLLLEIVGDPDPRRLGELGVAAAGFVLAAVGIARSLRRANADPR